MKSLVDEGPFEFVVNSISLPETLSITANVLTGQGRRKPYTTLPALGNEDLPYEVTRIIFS